MHSTARLGEFTFSGVPFFSGIHIVRLIVGTKHLTLLSILSDRPTDQMTNWSMRHLVIFSCTYIGLSSL